MNGLCWLCSRPVWECNQRPLWLAIIISPRQTTSGPGIIRGYLNYRGYSSWFYLIKSAVLMKCSSDIPLIYQIEATRDPRDEKGKLKCIFYEARAENPQSSWLKKSKNPVPLHHKKKFPSFHNLNLIPERRRSSMIIWKVGKLYKLLEFLRSPYTSQ